jgi:hypothetical protein
MPEVSKLWHQQDGLGWQVPCALFSVHYASMLRQRGRRTRLVGGLEGEQAGNCPRTGHKGSRVKNRQNGRERTYLEPLFMFCRVLVWTPAARKSQSKPTL